MLYILNLHNVIWQLYLNKVQKIKHKKYNYYLQEDKIISASIKQDQTITKQEHLVTKNNSKPWKGNYRIQSK